MIGLAAMTQVAVQLVWLQHTRLVNDWDQTRPMHSGFISIQVAQRCKAITRLLRGISSSDVTCYSIKWHPFDDTIAQYM